ncbi:MAG: hypothetical protein AB2A00_03255 [Myxococcota bacterium]
MTTIQPKSVHSAINRATVDKLVTEGEAQKVPAAIIKDLLASSNPSETLKLAAQRLKDFLAPFHGGPENADGVRMDQAARYKLSDLADALERAGNELETIKGGAFSLVMGLASDDGKLQTGEITQLRKMAEKMVAGAPDPAAVAGTLKDILIAFEGRLEMAKVWGQGPTRDEVVSAQASRRMDALSTFLGGVIAQHLTGANGGTVDPDGEFAKGVKDMMSQGGGFGGNFALLALPGLVDAELGKYDSTGFSGPAKLKLDAQAEARGKELLKYVDSLPGDTSDIKERLYRLVAGTFCPPDMKDQLQQQLSSADSDELKGALERMRQQAKELEGTRSFSVRRERAAMQEGIGLIEGELARRAEASGLTRLDTPERRKAVVELLKSDANVGPMLQGGGKIDADKMVFLTWDQAREAAKKDFAPNVDLDSVLMNLAGAANSLRRDAVENHAFARVPLRVPGESEAFPATVVLRRSGNEWTPARVADGVVPF